MNDYEKSIEKTHMYIRIMSSNTNTHLISCYNKAANVKSLHGRTTVKLFCDPWGVLFCFFLFVANFQ